MASPSTTAPVRLHVVLMLVLTFTTGIVDAAGFLGLDKVFTGNITGSVVIFGMAAAGAPDLPVVGPLCALGSFVVGAVAAGRVLRSAPPGWTQRCGVLFATVGVLVTAVALLVLATGRAPSGSLSVGVILVLGFAMGMQAAAARRVAVADVNTVVVTTVVAGIAADSRFGGRRPQPVVRRLIGVAAIGTGAVVGALAWRVHLGVPLLFAGAIIVTVSLVGHLLARSRGWPSVEA